MKPIEKLLAAAEYYGWTVKDDPTEIGDYHLIITPDRSTHLSVIHDDKGRVVHAIFVDPRTGKAKSIDRKVYSEVLWKLEFHAPVTPHIAGNTLIASNGNHKTFRGTCSCGQWQGGNTTGSEALRDAERHVTATKPWK